MTSRTLSMAMILSVLAAVSAASATHGAEPKSSFAARFARQAVCDALAEWAVETGATYCYPASLLDAAVVVPEPGAQVSLDAVLRGAGWRVLSVNGVTAIVRDEDDEKARALKKALLEAPDELARRTAAHALGRLTTPSAVSALVEGLSGTNPNVQFQCLEALWAIESDFEMRRLPGRVSMMKVAAIKADALAAVARSAADDKPRRAWRYAVTLLGRAAAPAVRPLALAGLSDADPRVRLIAARALRDTATADDEAAIRAFVNSTEDWAARREAVHALARFPGFIAGVEKAKAATQADEAYLCLAYEALGERQAADSIPVLAEALRTGTPNVAAHAAESLGRFGTPEADAALVAALKSPDEWRRAAAADGLSVLVRSRSHESVPALIVAAKDGPAVRAAVTRALAVLGGDDAHRTILDLSRDSDAAVRLAAARALIRIGGSRALTRLHELADDAADAVKQEARRGLGWLGGVKEAERLAAMARDPALGRDGADAALDGLGSLVPTEARDIAVRTLLKLMEDPLTCPFVAGRAAASLADPRLLPGILNVQAKNQAGMKRRSGMKLSVDCMDALGHIGTREATEALAREWWTYENMTRYQVGRALRDNLDRPAVHETLLALTRSSGDTRTAAAFSLSNSRDPRAVAALTELLNGRKEAVGAATSLGMIADPAATDALLAAAQDPAHPGRFAAARALRMRDLAWQPRVKQALVRLYGWREDGGPPPIEEQKPNTWVLRRWARDYDDMSISTLTYESAAAYDTRRGRVFQWGAHGKRYDSPQTGDTWVYDPATNTWTEVGTRERPPGTCMTREICYDGTNDRLIVRGAGGGAHGWLFFREQVLRQSSPWAYDPASDRWIPMRSAPPPNFAITSLIEFDRARGVVVALGRQPGTIWTYDTYTNRWTQQPLSPTAPKRGFGSIAYDCDRGRMLFLGEGALWTYDLGTGEWTDLKAANGPERAAPLVYDSCHQAAVAFQASHAGTTVQAYDFAGAQWTALKTDGMQPDYVEWDAAFDDERNVVVVCGGEVTSCPGSPNCRETWTYRLAARDPAWRKALAAPGPATATATTDGVRITWGKAPDERVVGYTVERFTGERTWGVKGRMLTEKPVKGTEFTDQARQPRGEAATYLVRSVTAAGETSFEPSIARTQPPLVIGLAATYGADRRTRVTWEKAKTADLVGYNVYRAPVTAGGLNGPSPVAGIGGFVKVNDAPVTGTEFVDDEPAAPGEQGWALAPRAYAVRAVNAAGVEGGLSPWAVTVPETTKNIEARRRDDGSVVVRWEKDPNPHVVGYVVYRMDNWRTDMATRLNEAPVVSTTFIDPHGRPTGERQRYWVTGVDRFGQEGPSGTGPWTFNR